MNEPPVRLDGREPVRRGRIGLRAGGNRLRLGNIVKLVIVCLIVGIVLSMFGIQPLEFWRMVWSAITGIYYWLVGIAGSLVAYVIIGACVVIPIVLIRRLWRRTTR